MHLLLPLLSLLCLASAQGSLLADLSYGSFQGAYSSDYNISYWRKIPFAAPPLGQNRFRAPQPPTNISSHAYNSSASFEACAARTVNGSEDCLYLGLYGRPWTADQPLRPVVVVFFGGGFIQGGGSFDLPPSGYPILNVSAQNDFIFVYPNYRTNAFGFLPGQQVADDPYSDFNNGLLDQQAALRWVHDHISAFGGDANDVTIWGQSAGAGSVVAQTIANGGETSPRLFNKALASSPFWPKTYNATAPEAQDVYDTFAAQANCSGADSLACLKSVDTQTLREAALYVSDSHTYNTSSFTWAPVLDGTFLRGPLTTATAKGRVNAEYNWGMYNLHEGENFIAPGLQGEESSSRGFNSSMAGFEKYLRGYLPGLSEESLRKVQELYPADGTAEEIDYNSTYVRAGLIYRDTVLACPAYWIAQASPEKGYVGEYTISPAKHDDFVTGSDTQYWNRVNEVQVTDPLIYRGYAGAFASFFQTADPNAHKLTNESQPGVPEIQCSGEQFVIREDGFANVDTAQLGERCDFWRSVGDEIPI